MYYVYFPWIYLRRCEENGAIYVSSTLLENKIELSDPAIKEEFCALAKAGGCSEISTPLTRFLHEQELLLSEDELHSTLEMVKEQLRSTLFLTILPTEGCNFRCPYCYEDHDAVSMSRTTLDRIKEYIAEQAPRFQIVRINWFGGEPTLCKDVILEINHFVQELQTKHDFHFISNMSTNGYLLTEEHFREYCAAGITNYQITLDGWDHDKTRPHVSGRGTLHTIMDNLTALAALPREEYPFHIVLRRNILAGDTDYSWYDHLNELFGKDGRFSVLVVPVGNWGGDTVQTMDLLEHEEAYKCKAASDTYLDQIGMPREGSGDSIFSDICYASYPYGFVFRPNDQIEKCTIRLGHPRNQVGYVDPDKGVILDDAANRLWTANDLRPECGTCSEVLKCLNIVCREPAVIAEQPERECTRRKAAIQ